jgi:hypothetical protein
MKLKWNDAEMARQLGLAPSQIKQKIKDKEINLYNALKDLKTYCMWQNGETTKPRLKQRADVKIYCNRFFHKDETQADACYLLLQFAGVELEELV